MDIFNTVLDAVKNQASETADSGAHESGTLASILSLINDPQTGGVSGLIDKFSESGLRTQVASWVGSGENMPITAEHIQSALGSSFVQDIAAKFGVDTAEMSNTLANLIPQVVDKLTPDGQVSNDNNLLQMGLSGLSGLLGNKTA